MGGSHPRPSLFAPSLRDAYSIWFPLPWRPAEGVQGTPGPPSIPRDLPRDSVSPLQFYFSFRHRRVVAELVNEICNANQKAEAVYRTRGLNRVASVRCVSLWSPPLP